MEQVRCVRNCYFSVVRALMTKCILAPQTGSGDVPVLDTVGGMRKEQAIVQEAPEGPGKPSQSVHNGQ